MTARKMRLGLPIRGHGYHPAVWRHPDVPDVVWAKLEAMRDGAAIASQRLWG